MFRKRNFENVDVNQRTLQAVKKAKIDANQILTNSTRDVMKLTKLSFNDVIQLQLATAKSIDCIAPVTALQIFEKKCSPELIHKPLSVGCDKIDSFLRGGILSGLLTEVSGESASGKTQLCLQICLTVQLPFQWGGLSGGAIYVCTEDVFPSKRLLEMIDRLKGRVTEFQPMNFMDNIFIEHAFESGDLEMCLRKKIPFLLNCKNIKLLVMDSVAASIRGDLSGEDTSMLVRSKKIQVICGLLHEICSKYNIPVVLVNQVVDDFNESIWRPCKSVILDHHNNSKIPALGMSWANEMNVRIALSRTKDFVKVPKINVVTNNGFKNDLDDSKIETYEANVRMMEILSAPHLPHDVHCNFIVDEEGVKGLD